MRAGRIHHRNGDYAKAIAEYEALLSDQAEGKEARDGLFYLVESYLADGDYGAALSTLERFLETYPEDNRRPQALFLLARSYQEVGNWSAAIEYYRRYLVWVDTIASYVNERIGDCYTKEANYPEAIEAYEGALRDDVSLDRAVHITEKLAQIYLDLGKYREAIHWYDAVLARAKIDRYRAKMEYLAGQAYLTWGRTDQAYNRFLEAVNKYPATWYAYLALVELVNAGLKVDEFQRGLVDYYNGAYEPAIQAFYRYIKSDPEAHSGGAHYYAGLAYQAMGSYALAAREFNVLIETHPQNKHLGQAWLARARALASQGDYEGAVTTYLKFVKLNPQHELASEALWQRARLAETERRFDEAAQSYIDLQKRYPQGEHGPEALFQAGLCYFRTAKYKEATAIWHEFLSAYKGSQLYTRTLFWLGKTLRQMDETEEAQRCLEDAIVAQQGDYYALRAGYLAQFAKGFSPYAETNILPTPPSTEEQKDFEAWLQTWAEPSSLPEGMGDLDPRLDGNGNLRRGLELLRVKLREEALAEFERLKDDFKDDPLSLYQLALLYREKELFGLSVACAKRLIHLSPAKSVYDVPPFLAKLAYPLYFDDLVVAEALARGFDPLLLFALIRQESSFEWKATSWADARGLTQIIPSTGEWIALKTGWSGFRVDDLYKPYLNVKFGAWYLTQQLEGFGGDLLPALAAYNAGPGRVARWLRNEAGSDKDLFVEILPLSESQLYVRIVCEHYAVYKALYR